MIPSNTPSSSLSISCVYYDTDIPIFEATLESIVTALTFATQQGFLTHSEIHLINNNPSKELEFQTTIKKFSSVGHLTIHSGHGNIGYGQANNIAINKTKCCYHLILNPDVLIAKNALAIGIEYLCKNTNVGLVAPHATNKHQEIEYLAKRTPRLWVLFLRALNKKLLNSLFKKSLDTYSYKDKYPSTHPFEIELASGCFMLCRTKYLQACKGFSNKYFLYFEDFDLSKRMSKITQLMHLPDMAICHLGGNAHKKGLKHTKLFLKSYFIFSGH